MSFLVKFQSLWVIFAVLLGLYLSRFEVIREMSGYLITPSLVLMLFGLFLGMPFREVLDAYRNRRFFLISLMVNFLITPAVAYLLGYIFLRENTALWIGFVMLLVTPCTDWYLIFTAMAGGNLPLSTSILPVNFFMQVALLPLYLELFFSKEGFVNLWSILESIAFVIVLPLLTAQALRRLRFSERLSFLVNFQSLFLFIAIVSMFASQGQAITHNPFLLLKMLPPLLIFFLFAFLVGVFLGRLLLRSYQNTASLTLTLMARNSPIALAIALTAFENEPLIALALVIGPLVELPVLFLAVRGLLLLKKLSL